MSDQEKLKHWSLCKTTFPCDQAEDIEFHVCVSVMYVCVCVCVLGGGRVQSKTISCGCVKFFYYFSSFLFVFKLF